MDTSPFLELVRKRRATGEEGALPVCVQPWEPGRGEEPADSWLGLGVAPVPALLLSAQHLKLVKSKCFKVSIGPKPGKINKEI